MDGSDGMNGEGNNTAEYTALDLIAGMKNGGFRLAEEETFTCPYHGEYKAKAVLFRGDRHDPTCPFCREEREKEETARISRGFRFGKTRLGAEYRDASFENFNAYTPELAAHLETARYFVKKPTVNLIMTSDGNGTGKNHLAAAILKRLGGVIYTVNELNALLRRSYGKEADGSEYEILEELSAASLLALDEIGKSKGSEWEKNWLSVLINNRYSNRLPTIFMTNGHFEWECPRYGCPECLSRFLGKDSLSRILQRSAIMKFTCGDYRMRLGAEFRKVWPAEAGGRAARPFNG
ncbi:MAG: ATP-binding protein [Spirochaetaceae bacterium]|jgi:DNA replication protein DnaC|nr:ATP-binding protein [Spirochaetaceae bacterium]